MFRLQWAIVSFKTSWIQNTTAISYRLLLKSTADVTYQADTYYNCPHINVLNLTGHVMHQQFNIQQLYVLPTLYLCVLYLSENKQRLVPLTA